ncbi:hypothetical protein MXD63_36140, partial [Frankia sp. Cpl3]|nr:hypothetical protein [Frankia sp. Cpl3]
PEASNVNSFHTSCKGEFLWIAAHLPIMPESYVDRIKTQVQAGRCACEIHNPQGTCCLGNVSAFVRGFKRSMS